MSSICTTIVDDRKLRPTPWLWARPGGKGCGQGHLSGMRQKTRGEFRMRNRILLGLKKHYDATLYYLLDESVSPNQKVAV